MRQRSQSHSITAYVNDPLQKKHRQTIFHSPFKGGTKNKEYVNPSFLSSTIFYPHLEGQTHPPVKLCVEPSARDALRVKQLQSNFKRSSSLFQLKPKLNYEQQMYMRKCQDQYQRIVATRPPEQGAKAPVSIKKNNNELVKQSQILHQFLRSKENQRPEKIKPTDSICYLQQVGNIAEYLKSVKSELRQELSKQRQKEQSKREEKRQSNEEEKERIRRAEKSFREELQQKMQSRIQNSKMLGDILRLQIKLKENKGQ